EGEELTSGEKYVLRSDILYELNDQATKKFPFDGHLGYIWKLLQFDQELLISAGRDNLIHIWNTNGDMLQTLSGHHSSILCLETINDDTFVSGSRDRQIKVWKRQIDGKFEEAGNFGLHTALVLSLCKLTDNWCASSGGDNLIKVWNQMGNVILSLTGHTNWIWQVMKLDENYIASCSEDHSIRIWDYRNGELIRMFTEKSPVFCLAIHPDQACLASGNLDGEITIRYLWDNFTEKKRVTFPAHSGIIRTLLFASNKMLVSGGEDNYVRIWNIEKMECISVFQHSNFVQSVICISDNRIMSASYDGTIRIHDIPKVT
ncbi:MAG TPA: WD40 repeat domain-containing protein, partial [Nitrosopumilaceae archaeon]|nr:WD40 repeat domain-containing protein [Nitrosopumilaceae archaeon]